MNLSLNAIASMVINSTFAGLKAKTNIPLSIDQVKDEIAALRSRLIKEQIKSGDNNYEGLYVKIPCIPLTCRDMGECCDVPSGTMALGGKVPKLFDQLISNKKAIRYAGSPNMFKPFRILSGTEYIYASNSPLIGNAPAVYFDNSENVWVFNPPTPDMDLLSVIVIPEDPNDLKNYACCAASDDDPYPVPGWMVDTITGKLINDYIRYYTMNQQQNNTQSAEEQTMRPQIQSGNNQ